MAVKRYNGSSWDVVAGVGAQGPAGANGSDGSAPLTTKGDLLTRSSTAVTRLGVGTNGQVLTADSAEATGLKWAAPAAASFVGYSGYNNASITANNNTYTEYTMNTEQYDTDGFHSTSTNTGRITIPSGKAGKYLITVQSAFGSSTATSTHRAVIYKNGNQDRFFSARGAGDSGSVEAPTVSLVMDLAVNDYIQIYFWQNTGGSVNLGNDTRIQVSYLGA